MLGGWGWCWIALVVVVVVAMIVVGSQRGWRAKAGVAAVVEPE